MQTLGKVMSRPVAQPHFPALCTSSSSGRSPVSYSSSSSQGCLHLRCSVLRHRLRGAITLTPNNRKQTLAKAAGSTPASTAGTGGSGGGSSTNQGPLLPYEGEPLMVASPLVYAEPLPEKDFGMLRGGQYPFIYDPVYGLPLVQDMADYGRVLREVRLGQVQEILWFSDPSSVPGSGGGTRCLLHYRDGGVAQSVLPQLEPRLREAMLSYNVAGKELPFEPRHMAELDHRIRLSSTGVPALDGVLKQYVAVEETDSITGRRGPRIGPTPAETFVTLVDPAARIEAIDNARADGPALLASMPRIPEGMWADMQREEEAYLAKGWDTSSNEAGVTKSVQDGRQMGWMDKIIISQDTQATILKYAPIIGPIVGSAAIVALYLLARLIRGDLGDRVAMLGSEDAKKKRTALKEARLAFLEEEVPALVARGATQETLAARCAVVNKALGEKLLVSDSELAATVEACQALITQGVDLTGAEGSASSGTQKLANIQLEEEAAALANRAGGDSPDAGAEEAKALDDMGKLNTARIRKAVDPRIMDVKRRVRAARRDLKRDSKVGLSDEIIFFDDVAGNARAKVELGEVVDFFRQPEKFKASGAKAPKGVLLVGPPGNGKTLMARAVAGEAGVAFISSSAAEFIEMYMGLGAARVRDLFNTARGLAPCIIFIDELDAVGRARGVGGTANEERDTTVNQLLTEMDGFEAEQRGIVVLGATNRKDVLDAALTRPGRFDRSIEVRRPDYAGRVEAMAVHMRGKPAGSDFDPKALALLCGGMSGAQIAGVCNTACFVASRAGRMEIMQADMVVAIEMSKYGKSYDLHSFVSPTRKHRFAVMEASISLAATLLPAMEPVDYINIMPSVRSPVGRTVLQANIGRYTTGMWTKRYLQEQLQVQLAGRAGEEIVFGVNGLSSLNQHRLMFARQIVTKLLNSGMSDHPSFSNLRGLGSNTYDPSSERGRFQMTTVITDSNQTRSEWVDTDMEMEALLNDGYAAVKGLLERNRPALDALVELLEAKQEVRGDEVRKLIEKFGNPADLEVRRVASTMGML